MFMKMLSDLISLIYPETCLNCNETLISVEKFICTSCKLDLPQTDDHLNQENPLFKKFAYEKLVNSVSSYLHFTQGGVAQKLLHSLKYDGQYEIGTAVGAWYGPELSRVMSPDLIIPIPIHVSKKRKRGYNQSFYFAEGLSKSFPNSEVREDLILRQKQTSSQTSKSKIERWVNLDNVYSDVTEDLSGRSVLVVDDVITTGATVGMLCDKLKEANVQSIDIVCIARGS